MYLNLFSRNPKPVYFTRILSLEILSLLSSRSGAIPGDTLVSRWSSVSKVACPSEAYLQVLVMEDGALWPASWHPCLNPRMDFVVLWDTVMEREKSTRNNPPEITKAMSNSDLNNVDLEGKGETWRILLLWKSKWKLESKGTRRFHLKIPCYKERPGLRRGMTLSSSQLQKKIPTDGKRESQTFLFRGGTV